MNINIYRIICIMLIGLLLPNKYLLIRPVMYANCQQREMFLSITKPINNINNLYPYFYHFPHSVGTLLACHNFLKKFDKPQSMSVCLENCSKGMSISHFQSQEIKFWMQLSYDPMNHRASLQIAYNKTIYKPNCLSACLRKAST